VLRILETGTSKDQEEEGVFYSAFIKYLLSIKHGGQNVDMIVQDRI
jgi:hypothetical protein